MKEKSIKKQQEIYPKHRKFSSNKTTTDGITLVALVVTKLVPTA